MKSKTIPQFDLPVIGVEAFNLAVESTSDGERLRQDLEAATKREQEAKEIENKQQSNLIRYELYHRTRQTCPDLQNRG
jgi:hypothetical protein